MPDLGGNDAPKQQKFRALNDRIWGEGNWVQCPICGLDDDGDQTYHHKDFHDGPLVQSGRSQHATTPQELSQPGASPDRRTPISSQPEEYQPKGQQT